MGLEMTVLAGSSRDPAAQVCPNAVIGATDDAVILKKIIPSVDVATFESEFLDPVALSPFSNLQPRASLIGLIQDRLTQKQLLEKFKIPTARFVSDEVAFKNLPDRFPRGFVLKKRRFGYDGYGTFVYTAKDFGKKASPEATADGFIAEELIPFRRELAFSLARNAHGEFAVLPLVETKQLDSRCFWVKGPVQHRATASLVRKFKRCLTELDYVGILAVELFETRDGLLVNELAPRVHNSAHYSIEALTQSQFELHLRAILGWPLKDPKPLAKGFAMVNLLGEGGAKTVLSHRPDGWLHWYGKEENRKGRKLGHITCIGATPAEALKRALRWRKDFKL